MSTGTDSNSLESTHERQGPRDVLIGFKQRPRQAGLADDGVQRPSSHLAVIRHWNGGRGIALAPLHDDVTAALANLCETVPREDRADLLP